jgi:hypothetical protein
MMRRMNTALIAAVSAVVALSGAACERQPAAVELEPAVVDSDEDIGGTTKSPISTSAAEYVLQSSGGGWATNIPITFRNVTDATLYIVNCHQGLAPELEKRTAGGWEPFWSGVQLQCLSPPMVIERGDSLSATIVIWGALPGGNMAPTFRRAELDGTYRIVLGSVVHNYDSSYSAGRFGDPVPIEHRVSNTFQLRRE